MNEAKLKKILIIYGTRPELLKLYPIINNKNGCRLDIKTCFTNQHNEVIEPIHKCLEYEPDFELRTENINLNQFLSDTLTKLDRLIKKENIDEVVVQGDTISTYAGALSAYLLNRKIYYVESGLRTYDLTQPYPEEGFRQMISHIATINFAPTESSKTNLISENILEEKVIVTGNTIVDMLELMKEKYSLNNIQKENLVLITLHRRENFGKRAINILKSIQELAKKYGEYEFIYPIHYNPKIRKIVRKYLNADNINLIEPIDYITMLKYIAKAKIILTDSGGIQEEAPSFNTPVIVLRESTERNELIESGCGMLVGANSNKIKISFSKYIEKNLSIKNNPFGNGKSSKRILNIIKDYNE